MLLADYKSMKSLQAPIGLRAAVPTRTLRDDGDVPFFAASTGTGDHMWLLNT